MALANFPKGFSGGLTLQGMPILVAFATSQASLGNTAKTGVWWVDSVNGLDGNATASTVGGTYVLPLKTVARAIALAAANDVIMVKPNHTESITAAATWNFAVKNLSVVGLGSGQTRPYITWNTATTATVKVSTGGQGTSFQNMVFDGTGFAAVAKMFDINDADVQFLNCEFLQGNVTNTATSAITTVAAANRLVVDGCKFGSDAGVTAGSAITLVGGDGHQITNSFFEMGYGSAVGAIQSATTLCTRTLIQGNVINNLTAANTKAITMFGASTGHIANNRMQILSGTAPITGTAMSWVGGNYYAAVIATAGTLI
jgi:hypothetical protein